jgi:ABC-type sugar transport system substrate-binding protein
MKKRIVALVLCIVAAVFMFSACTTTQPTADEPAASSTVEASESTTDDSAQESVAQPEKDVKLALVLHAMNSSFFTKISDGAKAAGDDLGITVDVFAPTVPNSLDEQIGMIETCIASGYDGIATVIWDEEAFTQVIQKATDAGIIVVGLNQDIPNSGRAAYVGQDNESAGYQAGKYMFEQIMDGKGKYIICSCVPTNSALIERAAGVQRAAAEFPGIEMIDILDIGTDLTGAYGIIENAYLAHPDVNALIGIDVFSEAVGTFITNYELQGKVFASGFDLVEGTLAHVKNNAMQLTVGQNPFMQGYYPIIEMYMHATYGYAPVDIDTGAMLVTKDNVDGVTPE